MNRSLAFFALALLAAGPATQEDLLKKINLRKGRILVSLQDGRVICLEGANR